MFKVRNVVMLLGITAALLLPGGDVFARGGGRGGGGGGGRGGGGGGGRGGGGGGGGGGMNGRGNQAPQENPIITQDRVQVNTDSAALNTATTTYTAALSTFKTTYMQQPDYTAAQKAVDDANQQLEAARQAVIAKLKASDPTYQAALKKESDAQKKLDQIRANGGNRDLISAQSQAIMDAGVDSSKIESDALAKDVPYQDAKKKLADAVALLTDQKTKMDAAVAADPDLTTKKSSMDTAKSTLTDAQNKLKQDSAQYGG